MPFIEDEREHRAAIRNGWVDEQGRVTADGAKAFRIARSEVDPNRRVADVLREAARRRQQAD